VPRLPELAVGGVRRAAGSRGRRFGRAAQFRTFREGAGRRPLRELPRLRPVTRSSRHRATDIPFTLDLGEDKVTADDQEGWYDARAAEDEDKWAGYSPGPEDFGEDYEDDYDGP
jgi:hypothetical protein